MQKKHLFVLLLVLLILTACKASQAKSIDVPTKDISFQASSTPISKTPSPTIEQKSPESKRIILPTQAPTYRVSIMAVGDIMLGRTIGDLILDEGYQTPFIYTAETLSKADITIGNLECPISNRGEAVQKKYFFRAPVDAAKSLSFAGFDILSLGNNHSLDYGPDALSDTLSLLDSEDIHTIGAGMDEKEAYEPVFTSVNGIRLAFLSFVDVPTTDFDYLTWEARPHQPGIAWAHKNKVKQGVKLAKKEADIVIVMVHNGFEFWQKVSDKQQEIAKLAIDNGASLVIGSHPHVLQRIETYKNGLIAYSMGNFVFDNFLFPPNYSAILSVELSPQGIESYELIDVVVSLEGIPQIMPYTIEE
jgi:poly-gamma-glutamate synthesis protein (capsule biosynthesis protein)